MEVPVSSRATVCKNRYNTELVVPLVAPPFHRRIKLEYYVKRHSVCA